MGAQFDAVSHMCARIRTGAHSHVAVLFRLSARIETSQTSIDVVAANDDALLTLQCPR